MCIRDSLSLVLRVVGDLAPNQTLRAWGGLLNVLAVLVFLANTINTARRSQASASASPS